MLNVGAYMIAICLAFCLEACIVIFGDIYALKSLQSG
jgi:hypothetical protein